MKIIINPAYGHLASFIESIPDIYDKEGASIYKDRNQLKVFEVGNEKIAVKSFRIPIFFNRIAYTCFRPSKAKRSYKYALILIEKQINTPKPIACIERKQNGLLADSYYVSTYNDYPGTLRELRYHPLEETRDLVSAFIRFTVDIHEKEVFPLDYSPGNILYEKVGGEYHFCLLDINRMQFKPVDMETGAYGLRRLWGSEETIAFMAVEYAKIRKFDEKKCEELALKYHRTFWEKYTRKHDSGEQFAVSP
ncbi:MAG: hypothetical protein LBE71_05415 [Dysgonamonadaceae bacterium]|jgi:hypothetical protein|nr:hypothetical protein [Dysgonamonadaceae bacterium]